MCPERTQNRVRKGRSGQLFAGFAQRGQACWIADQRGKMKPCVADYVASSRSATAIIQHGTQQRNSRYPFAEARSVRFTRFGRWTDIRNGFRRHRMIRIDALRGRRWDRDRTRQNRRNRGCRRGGPHVHRRLHGSLWRHRPYDRPHVRRRLHGSLWRHRPCDRPHVRRWLHGGLLRHRPCDRRHRRRFPGLDRPSVGLLSYEGLPHCLKPLRIRNSGISPSRLWSGRSCTCRWLLGGHLRPRLRLADRLLWCRLTTLRLSRFTALHFRRRWRRSRCCYCG